MVNKDIYLKNDAYSSAQEYSANCKVLDRITTAKCSGLAWLLGVLISVYNLIKIDSVSNSFPLLIVTCGARNRYIYHGLSYPTEWTVLIVTDWFWSYTHWNRTDSYKLPRKCYVILVSVKINVLTVGLIVYWVTARTLFSEYTVHVIFS